MDLINIKNILRDNTKDNSIVCIIEGGYNTSYITSLLVLLYYTSNENLNKTLDDIHENNNDVNDVSNINDVININDVSNIDGIYLQELIKSKFVDLIRKDICIYIDNINEIRNYLFILGWYNDDIDELFKNKDIIDLFMFLTKKLNFEKLDIDVMTYNNGILDLKNNINNLSYININPTLTDTNIKFLFNSWINYNINTNSNNFYKLNKIPSYLFFYIDRVDKHNVKNNIKIDIMNKIKFTNVNETTQRELRWVINSFICLDNKNKYYTLINKNDEWYKFEENTIPSIQYIDIKNDKTKNKLMSEVVFLLYVLCD